MESSVLIENDIYVLSRSLAIRIVNMYNELASRREYVMSKQILRSGTSIGANVHEGKNGQSRADFLSKMSIALKEATETSYWLDILHETNFITDKEFLSLNKDCTHVIAVLTKIIKNTKLNEQQRL